MTAVSKGIVYVLTNPAMPGLVKIGEDPATGSQRSTDAVVFDRVPVPFECAFAGVVEDEHKVERAFHKAFPPLPAESEARVLQDRRRSGHRLARDPR